MLTATCRICKEELLSPLVVTDMHKKAVAIGKLTVQHMEERHKEEMIESVMLNRQFNGFIIMNQFVMGDEEVTKIMEETRDLLAAKIMLHSPEEEEDDDDEDQEDQEEDNSDRGTDGGDIEDDEDVIICPECGVEIDISDLFEEEVKETIKTTTEVIEEVEERRGRGRPKPEKGEKGGKVIDVTSKLIT